MLQCGQQPFCKYSTQEQSLPPPTPPPPRTFTSFYAVFLQLFLITYSDLDQIVVELVT